MLIICILTCSFPYELVYKVLPYNGTFFLISYLLNGIFLLNLVFLIIQPMVLHQCQNLYWLSPLISHLLGARLESHPMFHMNSICEICIYVLFTSFVSVKH